MNRLELQKVIGFVEDVAERSYKQGFNDAKFGKSPRTNFKMSKGFALELLNAFEDNANVRSAYESKVRSKK